MLRLWLNFVGLVSLAKPSWYMYELVCEATVWLMELERLYP